MTRPPKLDRDRIVEEAILLLQEEGLDRLSLRNLAARLGVRAPALARHVGDKSALLALMSSAIFDRALARIPPGLTGPDWLWHYGIALWQQQQETRDVAALISTAPLVPGLDGRITVRIAELVRKAELPPDRGMPAQQAVQALVTGYSTFAKSARAPAFSQGRPIERAFEKALRALIAGFLAGKET